MRHNWTTEDDEALRAAVERLTIDEGRHQRTPLWPAVCGALQTERGIVVSPNAVATRMHRLTRAAVGPTTTASDEAWKAVADQLEAHEADTLDWLVEALNGVRDDVRELRAAIDALCVMWHTPVSGPGTSSAVINASRAAGDRFAETP